MTQHDRLYETLGWTATLTAGALLSVQVARMVVNAIGGPTEPVREIVEEALAEHRDDDSAVVQAFAEALEEEEAETTNV